ncbi:hypothetical protein VE03_02798 [Pseudogymnoascus sp. 23342-1-I1]|nr:hypothetical protein VE03_02798 [Pseudogymnoascus sp. 23342-1-I1]
MFLLQAVAVTVALATAVQAAALYPVSAVSVEVGQNTSPVIARGLLANPPPAAIIKSTYVTRPSSTELATIDERASEAVWLAIIGQTALITAAICTAGISAGPIGIAACATSCVVAAIASIWALAIKPAVPISPVRMARNEDTGFNYTFHPDYVGDADCNTGCKLTATSPQGQWTHFANSTKDGVTHNLHYYQSGKYRGLRAALVSSASTTKRGEVDVGIAFDEGAVDPNWVVSVYWEDDIEAAFDSFDRDDSTWLGDTAGTYFVNNDVQLGCMNAMDSDGIAFQSLILLDWQDVELQLTDDQIDTYLPLCVNETV